jgi:hypothetical protein
MQYVSEVIKSQKYDNRFPSVAEHNHFPGIAEHLCAADWTPSLPTLVRLSEKLVHELAVCFSKSKNILRLTVATAYHLRHAFLRSHRWWILQFGINYWSGTRTSEC